MSRVFYDHFINWEALEAALREHTDIPERHNKLVQAFDRTLHHEMFSLILTILPPHAHEFFIVKVKEAPHAEDHLQYLRHYEPDIDRKLQEHAITTQQRFFDAIHRA